MILEGNNLVAFAKEKIPEFNSEYIRMVEKGEIDEQTGLHIIFGYIFAPLLADKIKKKDIENEKKLFAFLEDMASSKDRYVVEVCDQSIIEALNDEFSSTELLPLMGEETKRGYEAVKSYMN